VKVTVDANLLVRTVMRDDPQQADVAARVLTEARLIAIALLCLCEFVWVLLRAGARESPEPVVVRLTVQNLHRDAKLHG